MLPRFVAQRKKRTGLGAAVRKAFKAYPYVCRDKARRREACARAEQLHAADNFQLGTFRNATPTQKLSSGSFSGWTRQYLFADRDVRRPDAPIPMNRPTPDSFREPPEGGLRITWFGHSTALIEIDGLRILTDPVFRRRASPMAFVGPRRFHEPPLDLDSLPPLDAVLISHDHYDHLERKTVLALAPRVKLFIVPLGVDARLIAWGVSGERVCGLNWGQEISLDDVRVAALPARHFSGRGLLDADKTLWASFALIGPRNRVFFSGDTGLFPEMEEIGAHYGPFTATLLDMGAYNPFWAHIHMTPEEAVTAHRRLNGDLLFPIHWGTFDMACLPWTEPIVRLTKAAEALGVRVAAPRPGESVMPESGLLPDPWWPETPEGRKPRWRRLARLDRLTRVGRAAASKRND